MKIIITTLLLILPLQAETAQETIKSLKAQLQKSNTALAKERALFKEFKDELDTEKRSHHKSVNTLKHEQAKNKKLTLQNEAKAEEIHKLERQIKSIERGFEATKEELQDTLKVIEGTIKKIRKTQPHANIETLPKIIDNLTFKNKKLEEKNNHLQAALYELRGALKRAKKK